jgi:hypothetical protein
LKPLDYRTQQIQIEITKLKEKYYDSSSNSINNSVNNRYNNSNISVYKNKKKFKHPKKFIEMRNILTLIVLLISFVASSQVMGLDVLNFGTRTTAQMNAISASKIQVGSYVDNSDTETLWRYNGSIWVDQAVVGSSLTDAEISQAFLNVNPNADLDSNDDDSQGLSLAGNTLNISNGTGVDLTPILGGGSSLTDAEVSTAFLNINPNTDLDASDDGIGGGIVAEGVFTVPSGATTYSITHGLGYVPDIQRIQIQRASSFIGSGASDYITNVTSSSFDLVVGSTSTAGDYAWRIFGTGLLVGEVDTDDQNASQVPFTPTGNTVANTTQSAIVELQTEIDGIGGGSLTTDQVNRLANASEDPLSFAVSADRVLIPGDRTFDSGGSIGRKKILTAATEVTLTIDNSYAVDDVQRFSTTGSGIVNLVPDAGVTLAYAGKTTLEGATMSGDGSIGYIVKESTNNYRFYSESITGFAINSNDAIEALSPIHYWTPESIVSTGGTGGSSVTGWDDTIGTLNGTVVGSVTLSLDGTQQETRFEGGYIDFPDVASVDFINGTDSYTWVWKTGAVQATTGYYFSKHNNSGRQYGAYIGSGNDNAIVGGAENNGGVLPATGNIVYALVVNASTYNFYKDGVLIANNIPVGLTRDIGQSLNFGSRTDGGYLYNGSLERVAVFAKALIPSELDSINAQF